MREIFGILIVFFLIHFFFSYLPKEAVKEEMQEYTQSVRDNYMETTLYEKSEIDKKKKVPSKAISSGLYEYRYFEEKATVHQVILLDAEAGTVEIEGRLSWRGEHADLVEDIVFKGAASYTQVGSVITFENIEGDKGLFQLEGFPVEDVSEGAFTLYELSTDGEKSIRRFVKK